MDESAESARGRIARLAALLAAPLLAAAAACGGGGGEPADATASASPATATAAAGGGAGEADGDQLRIGLLTDFTGELAAYGEPTLAGAQLAIAHLNAAGGVLGRDVVLVPGDTRSEPAAGVAEARRLIGAGGVHAIAGPITSAVALAVLPEAAAPASVPVVSPSATSPALTGADDGGYLFRTAASDAVEGVMLAELAEREGYDNVGVIYRDDAWGRGLADVFARNFGGAAALAPYEPGQSSYLAQLEAAAAGGAGVLVSMGFTEAEAVYVREALEGGFFSRFIFSGGSESSDLIAVIGAEALDGSVGVGPGVDADDPSTAAWDAAWLARRGALPALPYVRETYDAVIAIALAAESAGSLDGAAIRDRLTPISGPPGAARLAGPAGVRAALEAVRAGQEIDYQGAASPIDWDAAGDVTRGVMEIYRIRGGAASVTELRPFDLAPTPR